MSTDRGIFVNQPYLQGSPNLIRAANDRAAYEALASRGPLTRPEIGALLGLSKPTASQLLIRLQEAGLVELEGMREGGPGRAAELYRINPKVAHVACCDVTPERIETVVADVTGTVVGMHTLASTPDGEVIDDLKKALAGACHAASLPVGAVRQCVIGIQGALNPMTRKLGYAAHMPAWRLPDLPAALQSGLGVPVAVENDVNLVAMAELAGGAARGVRNFVLLWAADGLGLAIVINGALYRGATGGAGEIGYMPVPGATIPHPSERPANYGFHALAGGPTLVKVLRAHGFRGATPDEAMRAAMRAWEAPAPATAQRAEQALEEVATRLATGLAAVVSVMDPEMVILAGDVLTAGHQPLRRKLEERLHGMTIPKPPLRLSELTGNPVLTGALGQATATIRDRLFGT